jgi:hypothetical protein
LPYKLGRCPSIDNFGSVETFGSHAGDAPICQSCDQNSSFSRAPVAHEYLDGESPSFSPLNTRSYPQAAADTFGKVVSEAPRGGASTIEGAKIMGKRGVHPKIDLRIDAARAGDVARVGHADIAEPGRVVPEEQLERGRADQEVLGSSEKSDV